jgi:hypothetical protein
VSSECGRYGRRSFNATVVAFGWSLALVVATFLVPVYSGVGESASSTFSGVRRVAISPSLVGVNGLWVLIPVAVPVVLTVLVWIALHRKCSRGSKQAGVIAWSMVVLLCAFCVVGAFSIGVAIAPVATLLGYAAFRTPIGAA